MMVTFYLLYVLVGGGAGNFAWGGPALFRFDNLSACEAAAAKVKKRRYVLEAECLRVTANY